MGASGIEVSWAWLSASGCILEPNTPPASWFSTGKFLKVFLGYQKILNNLIIFFLCIYTLLVLLLNIK